jgi:hypothetical protein
LLQAAEKALKAVVYFDDYEGINTKHKLHEILPAETSFRDLEKLARRLQV